jgi:Flp pilus assembly protein CpaB
VATRAAARGRSDASHNGNGTGGVSGDGRPGPGVRTVRPRRGLPGTRAVVGGVLVAAAGVGLFSAATTAGQPGQPYVVAGRALTAGTRLQPADLALAEIELPPTLRARAFDDPTVLDGATLLAPVGPGELIQVSAVIAGGTTAGSRELTFTVERGRIGPTIRDGERIDLLATYGTGDDAYTLVAGRDLPVITVDRTRVGVGETSPVFVTVAVADADHEVSLGHAAQVGKLTVVRTTGAPPGDGPPPTYRAPGAAQP